MRKEAQMCKHQLSFIDKAGETVTYKKAGEKIIKTYTAQDGSNYELHITQYEVEGYFGKRQAVLFKEKNRIAEFWRDYSDFPFTFAEHINGNLYFICSEEYHGQVTIFNISTGKRRSIHPRDGMENPPEYGSWFMWIEISYNEQEQELDAYGGYWGCEWDFGTRTFDFSRPNEVPYNQDWWTGIRTTEGTENQDYGED